MKKTFRSTVLAAATLIAAGGGAVAPAGANPVLQLQFPGPSETTANYSKPLASFHLAIGPWQQGSIAMQTAEGSLQQSAWRIAAPQLSTLELAQSLRKQIAAAGYSLLFECETETCGGFDFRYGTAILPEPDMHVDLGDFRYLAAERSGPAGKEYLGLIISRSPQNSFVQMTRIGGAAAPELTTSTKTPQQPAAPMVFAPPVQPATAPATNANLAQQLDLGLPQVLDDLVFPSGSAALADADYASLHSLADWLHANPQKTITLVGHTDASGGLAANISLSKKRAESVRQALISGYSIAPDQLTSNGVGPLAPRASDLTEDGRQKNRRVEVVLTPTQ